jgi:2-polyprenyl-3-methyl-5-hydroxy-6-metoxy-1,4-benzoquinol methylase
MAFRPVIAHACDRVMGRAGSFAVQACEGCALVLTRPRPTAAALAHYYEGSYSGTNQNVVRALQTGAMARLVSRYRLGEVQRVHTLKPGDRLLDVGCGYGGFLQQAVRSTRCHAIGIDQDAGSISEALDAGRIRYHAGTLEDAPLPPASQDVITFFESLEHHADPVTTLKAAHAALKPGGICVVEVPNFDGVWRKVLGTHWLPLLIPQHLTHFTPQTLHATFSAAGFRDIRPHRSMFFPTESTGSIGLWLNRKLGRPIRRGRLRWQRPDGALMLLMLMLWWILVEMPAQAVLQILGRTGHQLMSARKSI